MIKEALNSWRACGYMNFDFDHVLITMSRWCVRGYVSCLPNESWHKAATKNTTFCSKEAFFTHSLVDGQVRSYCNSHALQKPLVLELVKSSFKRFFSDSFMSSLTLVLAGTGDEDEGGFVLNGLDCYLECSDLLDLWKEVEMETGIATQKPFLLIVDQCYALRLSKNSGSSLCWHPLIQISQPVVLCSIGLSGLDYSVSSLLICGSMVLINTFECPTFSKIVFGGPFHSAWCAVPKSLIDVFTRLSPVFCFRKFFKNPLPENWAVQCASGDDEEPAGASFAPFFVQCQPRCSGLVEADVEAWKQHSDLDPVLPQPGWAAEESPIVKRFQSWTLLEAAGISGVWGRIRYTLDIWYVCLLLLNLERGWTLNEVFFGKRQWCQSLCCAHGYTSQLCHTDTRIHMNTPDFVVASSCYHFAAFQHVLSCCECCAVLVCVIPSLPFSARVIACIWSYGITIVATSIIYLDQPVVRFLDQPARKFDVQIFFHFSSSVWSVPNSCHYEPQHHPKGSSIQGAGRLAMGGRGEWYRQHRNQSWQY